MFTGRIVLCFTTAFALCSAMPSHAQVVVSQAYGGGGNAGSLYRNDFIELYNRGSSPVSVAGWSVQYASATGSSWSTTALAGTIPAKSYYLVQQAAGTNNPSAIPLPTPDATGTIGMSGTAFKVALVNSTTALSGTNPVGGPTVVDFVGAGATANGFEGTGPAPAPSNTASVIRKNGGETDTNDNAADFQTSNPPNPRNTSVNNLNPAISTAGSPAALGSFVGSVSSPQTFQVNGINLTDVIVASVSAGLQISSDGVAFSGTATFPAASGSASGTLYVRIAADALQGEINGQIQLASAGATSVTVPVSGVVRPVSLALPYGPQDFSSTSFPWYALTLAGSQNWTRGSDTAGNFYMEFNGFGSTTVSRAWLILGPFNIPPTAASAIATFTIQKAFTGPDDELELVTSTSYDGISDPSTAAWTVAPFTKPAAVANTSTVMSPSGDVALPASVIGQANVFVAFRIVSPGTGSAQTSRWRVDDFAVSSSAPTGPTITAAPSSLSGLTATQGNFGPSTNFVVNASNLSNNITVTANDAVNFAISTNNTDFTNTLSLPTNSSGAVTNASVFVRLTGAAPDGDKSGTVSLVSDSVSTNVAVSGTVSPPPVPTLTATPTNVGPLQAIQGSPSVAYGTYALNGTAITNSVTISAPAGLQVSYTNDGSGFGSSLTIPSAPPGGTFSTNVYVRISAGVSIGTFTNFITNSTPGAISNAVVQVTGKVDAVGTPQLSPADQALVLTNFTTERGTPSGSESFSLSGQNLVTNVTVTPPVGWQVSTNPGSTFFTNAPLTVPTNAPAGGLTNATVYVRLAGATTTNYTTNNTRLSLVSGAISNNVLLAGSVTNPAPSLLLSTNTLTNFVTPTNTPSASTNFTIFGTNLTSNVTVTPPTGWQVSPTNPSNFSSNAITIGTNNDATVNANVFLRIGSNAVPTDFTNSQVVVQSGTTSTNLIAVGSVTSAITLPTIANFSPTNGPRGTLVTINGAGFGSVSSNGVAFGGVATTNFTVVGSNQITAFVPLSAPTGRITVSNPVGVATSSTNFTIDALTLRVPPVIGGGVVTPVRLSVPSPVPADTLVVLQSSVVPTATVPATVTIPAGQSYVVFPITTTTVGANVNVSISAFSANYLGATAPTTVSSTFIRAASFMEEGYDQDFAAFTNFRTLPYGWTVAANVPQYTNNFSPWGTTNVGIKHSIEGTDVFGIQHEPLLLTPGTNLQTLTLRNDTGTNVAQIRITYTGRTTNAFINVDRFPAYTVTVAAAVNTNVVNFTTNVSDLNYSTGAGDNVVVTAKLALTNTAVANGIPAWTNFTVTWASTAGGAGFDNSAQIGLGDLTVELVRPYVQLTPVAGVNDFITSQGTASVPRLFYASGQDLQSALVVTAPDNFEVSLAESTGYGPSVSFNPVSGTVVPTFVYARIKASAPAPQAAPATVAGNLSAASTNATTAVQPISGVVFAAGGATQVLASPEALTNFTAVRPGASSLQSFFASGINLSNNITVSATTGFQVSTNTNTSGFATGVIIPRDAFNRVNPTPVYVRLAPNQSVGAKNGTATIASGATNDTVVLGGAVTAPPPLITLTGTFTPFSTTRGVASAAQTCTVSATDLVAPLLLTAPEGYEISNGGTYSDTLSLSPSGGNLAATTISVRIADYAPAANPLAGNLTASSAGAVTRSLALTGTVTTNGNAWISARPSSLTGFLTLSNVPSDAQTFTVQAANITEDLRVSVSDKYEISLDGATYTSSISLERQITGSGGGGGFSIVGSDTASNYGSPAANTWTNGSDLGEGFGPWEFLVTPGTGFAGVFVGNPADAGITGFPSPAFGIYANPGSSGAETTINRAFDTPLSFDPLLNAGRTFSFQWGVNWDSDVGNKGFSIFAGASEIVTVNQGGFPGDITFNGANTAIPFGTGPMTWSVRRTAVDNLEVTSSARDGTTAPVFTTNIAIASDPTSFRWYVSAMGAGDQRQPYFNNLQITAPTSGNPGDVALTTLFVRLKAQSGAPGAVDGTITASAAPAASRTIALSGRVPAAPTINVSPTNLPGFLTTAGTASPARNFTVSAQTLGGALNLSAPTGFEISLVSTNGFGPTLSLTPSNESVPTTTVFVRFAEAAAAGDYTNSLLQLSANGLLGQTATNTVQLSGTVFASNGTPQLALPVPPALSGFSTTAGTPSASQSYVISGTNLTALVVAAAPANYEISTNNVNFAPIVTNAVSGTGLVSFTNYVRITASAAVGSPVGNVNISSVGVAAPRTVALNGTVAATPALNVDPNLLSGFQSVADFASPSQSFRLGGSNMAGGPVTISASSPYQVSLNNTDWATQTNFTPGGATFNNTTVFVRLGTNSVPTNSVNGTVTFSGQGITNIGSSITVPTVALSGSTLLRPLITLSTNSLGPFESVSGFQPSASRSFTVSGTNLLTNITVAPPSQYEISTNNGTSWTTNPVTLVRTLLPQNSAIALPLLASDFANNYYGSGWTNGANGGTGFGLWAIMVSNNPPTYYAGAFAGDPNAAGVTGMATTSFGLYANPDGTPAVASASRAFGTPLQVGQTFSLQWGINWDSGAGNKGFSIFVGTNEVARVNQGAFPGDVTFNGMTAVNGTTGFGPFPMTWTFSRTNTNSLLVTSTGRTNGTNIVFTTNVAITDAPDSFRFFTSAMQAGDQRQAYFNNLQVSGSAGFVNETAFLVRLKSNAVSGIANQAIDVTSPIYAEQKTVTLNGQVYGQTLTVSTNSLTGFATTRGVASQAQQFTVSGSNLVTNVTVAAPANYEVSSAGASTGFASSLTLPVPSGSSGGNITNVPLWVRISAQATNTTASGTVNLTSALASASVTVNGDITNPQQPALNENYINFIYQRLLYRNPTTDERLDYLSLLGGAGNIGNTTNKTKMITELMGFDPTRNLFNWQIVFDNVDGSAVPVPANYVISSLAFAPFARLGLTPTAPIVEDFIATSRTPSALAQTNIPLRTYAPSPMFNFNNAVAPYDTKDSVALAFADLLALPQFAAPREQFETTSTSAVPYISWLNSAWFWGKNTPSGFEGGSQAMIDMYRAYPAPYSRGLMAAFRSMYQWVVLAQSPSNVSNGSSLEGPFQLRANFAALDFQLWRNWGYSATSTAYSVDNVRNLLLRFPLITSGNLPMFAADQAFPGYEITASNATTPEAGLPEGLYYSALNLPAGLAVNPSTGAIFQTGAVAAGTYNNIIVQAQNFVGIGQKTVSLTVQPPTLGPATGWMVDKGLPGANFAAVANNDDDRDGLSNTQEYAFGLEPLSPDASAFSAVINGSSLLVSWKGLRSGATYELQRSGDLSSWTNVDTSTLAPSGLLPPDLRYQLWQTNISLPVGADSIFYRIKATFEPGALD